MEAPHLHQKAKLEMAEGYGYRMFLLDLATSPTEVEFAQLFQPSFWRLRLHQLNELDILRVVAKRRDYDQLLCVRSKSPGGLLLSPWPTPLPGSPEFAALMANVGSMTEISEKQMADELQAKAPIEPPATGKKARVPA
jgi:hypothetical protein